MKLLYTTLTLLILSGCATTSYTTTPSEPEINSGTGDSENVGADLDTTSWRLSSLGYSKIGVPEGVTLNFKDGFLGGSSGCGDYAGYYSNGVENINITVNQISTEACDGSRSGFEDSFIKKLKNSNGYIVKNGKLILKKDETPILIFMKGL